MEWSQSGRASRFQQMEVIVALKQRNVEKLEERYPPVWCSKDLRVR